MLKEFINWLNSNPWLNVIFLFLALGSIILSIYLFLKGRKEKRPTYIIKSFNLVKDKLNRIEQVKILYDDKLIKNLTITKISLWNNGKETINNIDVAPKDPIRLEINEDYQILNANILLQKKEANNFQLELDESKKSVLVKFDYFHTYEGVVIELSHTGTSSKDLSLMGTIKGVENFQMGQIDNDHLVINRIISPLRDKVSKFWWNNLISLLLLPILAPIFIIVMPFDMIYAVTRTVPKEYYLDNEE